MKNVLEILEERRFIEAVTSIEAKEKLNQPCRVYCGFDPTSDSLHLGNFVAIMGLAWFQRCGHSPYVILGGATAMVGDPSGKNKERPLLNEQAIKTNVEGIRKNLEHVLNQGAIPPILLNNYDWFKKFSFIDFLRDVGKLFRMGPMLSKESVKSRLESEEGLSFTEFTYQLLQGYDFLHLHREHKVTFQVGGSDQWGNITSGTELVRRVGGQSVFGVTFPLLVRSDGQKFGKSESGAIWLSPEKTSPFEFYQYLVRVPDADVIRLMELLTFMDIGEIRRIEAAMKQKDYMPNTAQKRLAEEVTKIVHGETALQAALKATEALQPGGTATLDKETLFNIASDIPTHQLSKNEVIGLKVIDLLCTVKMVDSKSEARRLVRGGGVRMNNHKVEEENQEIQPSDLIEGEFLLLALGKKNQLLVQVNYTERD